MGNRAVITTREAKVGVYLHWNGGRDSVEAFLKYCELQQYRAPSYDNYGWARLCQVIGNFFGGGLSIGIDAWDSLEQMCSAGSDNGVYIIDGWKIVARVYPYDGFVEQQEYDLSEMLRDIDASQPVSEQLGGYLIAEEAPTDTLKVGDRVWYMDWNGSPSVHTVMTIKDGHPFIDLYDHDGDWTWNSNNRIDSATVRLA